MAGALSHLSVFVYTEVWLSPSEWLLPFLAAPTYPLQGQPGWAEPEISATERRVSTLVRGYSSCQLGMVPILWRKETRECRGPHVHLFGGVSAAKGALQQERAACPERPALRRAAPHRPIPPEFPILAAPGANSPVRRLEWQENTSCLLKTL